MAAILIDQVLNVTFGCRFGDVQNGLNRQQYFVTVVGGGMDDQTLANALSTTVAASFKNYLNVGARYQGLRLQIVGGPAAPSPGVSSTNGAGAGTNATEPLPTQTAMLISKRTAVAGKVGLGRMYLPFWSESDNSVDAKPEAAALALGNALRTLILSPMVIVSGGATATLVPCLAKKSNGWIPLQITSSILRTNWATQRRRGQINKGDASFPPV